MRLSFFVSAEISSLTVTAQGVYLIQRLHLANRLPDMPYLFFINERLNSAS